MTDSPQPLLSVRNLDVRFDTPDGAVQAVSGVDFDIAPGEFVGVVGESGCGKSQMLLATLGLLARNGTASGSVRFGGNEILNASESVLRRIRGNRISFVFQDPMTALNPHLTIGRQLTEGLRLHKRMDRSSARARAVEMLRAVHIPEAERRLAQYPHELSGGMRQRVVIAMALICEPDLILADEPTTALDVTVQAQILALLRELRERFGTAVVLVTHDLGVVAQVADRVAVMYAGRIVERGGLDAIAYDPRHPYTAGLQRSVPHLNTPPTHRLQTIPGAPPNLSDVAAGCAFAPRCVYRLPRCGQERPPLEAVDGQHLKACFHEGPLSGVDGGAEKGA